MQKFLFIAVLICSLLLMQPLVSYGLYKFHSGGEGFCDGCHLMHKTPVQAEQDPATMEKSTAMLKGSDASSTCLLCHAEAGKQYNVFSHDGSMHVPGGDFYWLKKTFTWIDNSQAGRSEGAQHGHNIVASDYGLNADYLAHTASGGDYPSYALGCTSCHDPHGTTGDNTENSSIFPDSESGNYMLLGGIGYLGGTEDGGVPFAYPAPVAVYNTGDLTESDLNHPAYGSGMSEWCANCHYDILFDSFKHPAGNNEKLSMEIISDYNAYIRTGDMRGVQANAYLSLVPFELGTEDTLLLDPSSRSGPTFSGNANVMCLTCHRAHASAFENIGRWDFTATFLADSHPKLGDNGATGSDVFNSYYGRDMTSQFGKYQRQLCNKCHIQD